MSLPSFFNVTPAPAYTPIPIEQPPSPADVKARILAQFEVALPRIIQQVYAGYTISRAVQEYAIPLDYGMFNRWVRKDPTRRALLEEAEEARAEVWADLIIEHAEGVGHAVDSTIERSKFACDQYKFLMSRQSKKRYGDTKNIDVTHTISIAAALEASKQRVIEAMVVDDSMPEDEGEFRALTSNPDLDEDDDA